MRAIHDVVQVVNPCIHSDHGALIFSFRVGPDAN